MPHVESLSVGIWVEVGARDETEHLSGICHFIEHMMFKGTESRRAFDIARDMDAIGGHANAFTSMEHTCYHGKVLATHAEKIVDLLSDIFLNSIFDPNEIQREKEVILQEINMMEDNPEDYLHFLSGKAFYGDHSLGSSILGPRENLNIFTSELLKGTLGKWYSPDRIIICAAGKTTHEEFLDLVAPLFENLNPGTESFSRLSPKPLPGNMLRQRDLEQAHISISLPALSSVNEKRFELALLNLLLGGNMSSALFQEIRENRGLAYSVYSYISSYTDSGSLSVYAGVHPDNIMETLSIISGQMQKFVNNSITETDLDNARECIKGSIFLSAESTDSQMLRLCQNEVLFERYIPLSEISDKINSVSLENMRELAALLFRPEKAALAILGPVKETIETYRSGLQ